MTRRISFVEGTLRVAEVIAITLGLIGGAKIIHNQAEILAAINARPVATQGGGEPPPVDKGSAERLGADIAAPDEPSAKGPESIKLANEPWPTTAKDFLAAVQVPEDQVAAELKADPYYRPLQEGMITQEFDAEGHWTGGWQILLERDAGNGDHFPFVVIRNSGTTMQYGYMHDTDLRVRAGFTAEEVAVLGIGANHIGAGVPVTGDVPVAVEGMTFYPQVNDIDGSHSTHTLLRLGSDMQTMDQRLARFTHSNVQDSSRRARVSKTDSIFGTDDDIFASLRTTPGVTFILDPNKTVGNAFGSFQLGGQLPNRIRSFSDLPKRAQMFQKDPQRGIRRK